MYNKPNFYGLIVVILLYFSSFTEKADIPVSPFFLRNIITLFAHQNMQPDADFQNGQREHAGLHSYSRKKRIVDCTKLQRLFRQILKNQWKKLIELQPQPRKQRLVIRRPNSMTTYMEWIDSTK